MEWKKMNKIHSFLNVTNFSDANLVLICRDHSLSGIFWKMVLIRSLFVDIGPYFQFFFLLNFFTSRFFSPQEFGRWPKEVWNLLQKSPIRILKYPNFTSRQTLSQVSNLVHDRKLLSHAFNLDIIQLQISQY